MTGKEIINRILAHDHPPRIGVDFLENNPSDFLYAPTAHLVMPGVAHWEGWNQDPALLAMVPGFSGEVSMSAMGNIYGRLNGKTKGECIKGALQEGWEKLESFTLPLIDEEEDRRIEAAGYGKSDKFVLGTLPFAVFSSLRDGRHMDNALMDTLLEPDMVCLFLDKVMDLTVKILDRAQKNGLDGIMITDDLGMQHALFFNPGTFRTLFKPYYKKLAGEIHERGMKFFVHSCGLVYEIVGDFIEAGVDVFQFDQPELSGSAVWAGEFGDKAAFYCPVDIQKIMSTGNRQIIEEGAFNMVARFKEHGGSLIAKDYPTWEDLNVPPEWQQWARDVILANAGM
jgi:hypothetical protein